MPLTSAEIKAIEETVRDKIRMKSNGVENADPLKRAFKHFDTDSSGTVDMDEFARAMERFGIDLPRGKAQELFMHYDDDGSGNLSYEEFSEVVLGDGVNNQIGAKDLGSAPFASSSNRNPGGREAGVGKHTQDLNWNRKAAQGPAASQHLRNSGDILSHQDPASRKTAAPRDVRSTAGPGLQGKNNSHPSHLKNSGNILGHYDPTSKHTRGVGASAVNSKPGPGIQTRAFTGEERLRNSGDILGHGDDARGEVRTSAVFQQKTHTQDKRTVPGDMMINVDEDAAFAEGAKLLNRPGPMKMLVQTVRDKVMEKSPGVEDNGVPLKRAFIYAAGAVDCEIAFTPFWQAIRHLGSDLHPSQYAALFLAFDTTGNGYVDFDEFCVGIMGRPSDHSVLGNGDGHKTPFGTADNDAGVAKSQAVDLQWMKKSSEPIPERLKSSGDILAGRDNEVEVPAGRGWDVERIRVIVKDRLRQMNRGNDQNPAPLKKAFEHFDADKNGLVDYAEFERALNHFGVHLEDSEMELLFTAFDVDQSGSLTYNEFCSGVIGPVQESSALGVSATGHLLAGPRHPRGEFGGDSPYGTMSHSTVNAATVKTDTGFTAKGARGPAASQHLRNSGDILGHGGAARGQVRVSAQMQGKQQSGLTHQYGSGDLLAHADPGSRKTANPGAVNSTVGAGFTSKSANGPAASQHLRNSGDILGHAEAARGGVRNSGLMQGKLAGPEHLRTSGSILSYDDPSSKHTRSPGNVSSAPANSMQGRSPVRGAPSSKITLGDGSRKESYGGHDGSYAERGGFSKKQGVSNKPADSGNLFAHDSNAPVGSTTGVRKARLTGPQNF